jgi:hypothetical protein
MYRLSIFFRTKIVNITAVLLIIVAVISMNINPSFATPDVLNRYDKMSNSAAGATATHLIGFTYTDSTDLVGSILIQFCSNSPLFNAGIPCIAPTGLDLSHVVLSNQTGETGFSINTSVIGEPSNDIIINRSPAQIPAPNNPSSYQFDNIVNPSSIGESFVKIQTFSSQDATGSPLEKGGIAIAITPSFATPGFNVSSIVPPYLTFCSGTSIPDLSCGDATGDQIDFGTLSNKNTSYGSSQFLIATNAGSGYSVYVDGTTLTSGNNVIPQLVSPSPVKTGTSLFGLNLVSNTNPFIGGNVVGPGIGFATANYSHSNDFTFNPGDTIASSVAASDYSKYTVSYVVDVDQAQPPGVYATTLTYICLANF